MSNRFVYILMVFTFAVLFVYCGLSWKWNRELRVAARFEKSLRTAVKEDPRFERLQFEGVSWSGPGHPIYIPVSGAVRSRADWLALSNLIHQANPPVEVNIWWVFLEDENAPHGIPR